MSVAVIDLASFVSGLGANAVICDHASFAMGSAADIEVPGLGQAAVIATADIGMQTVAFDAAQTGSAGDTVALLAGASGCDTLFVSPAATTGLDTGVILAPQSGAGLAQLDAIDGTLGLSDVQLSPAPLFAALAQQQISHAGLGFGRY